MRLGSTSLWRAVLYVLLVTISYLALTPAPPASVDLGWDKLNHTAAFAALALAACLGWPETRYGKAPLMLALLAYGGAIEIIQWFVPGRSCEWGDLLADAMGISVGALLAAGALRLARRTT